MLLLFFREIGPPRRVFCVALPPGLSQKDGGILLNVFTFDNKKKFACLLFMNSCLVWLKIAQYINMLYFESFILARRFIIVKCLSLLKGIALLFLKWSNIFTHIERLNIQSSLVIIETHSLMQLLFAERNVVCRNVF